MNAFTFHISQLLLLNVSYSEYVNKRESPESIPITFAYYAYVKYAIFQTSTSSVWKLMREAWKDEIAISSDSVSECETMRQRKSATIFAILSRISFISVRWLCTAPTHVRLNWMAHNVCAKIVEWDKWLAVWRRTGIYEATFFLFFFQWNLIEIRDEIVQFVN